MRILISLLLLAALGLSGSVPPPVAPPPAKPAVFVFAPPATGAVLVDTSSGRSVAVAVVASPYRWPIDGYPLVARRFDPPPLPWLPGHRGVDLAAPPGTTVRAAGPGVVAFAGMVAGRGVVSIDHPNGMRTTYEPVRWSVSAGMPVAAGDLIGTLADGHLGCAAAACLHWGLRLGTRYLDPLILVGAAQVRLLPTDATQIPR